MMSVSTSAIDVSQSESLSLDLSQIKREQRHVANLLRYVTDKPLYNARHRLSTGQVAEIDEHEELNWIGRAHRQRDTKKHTYSVTSRHTDRQTRRHTDTGILNLQRLRTNTPNTPVSTDDINLSTQQSSQQYSVVPLCDDNVDLAGPTSPRRPTSPCGAGPGPAAAVSQLTLPAVNSLYSHMVQGDINTGVERTQTLVVRLPQIHQELQTPTPPQRGLTVTSRNNSDDVIMLHGLFASRDSSAVTSRSHSAVMSPDEHQDTTTTSFRHVLFNNNNNNKCISTVDVVAKSEFTPAAVAGELLIDDKFSQLLETTTTTATTTCDEIPTFNILLQQSTVATYFRSHDWLGQEISRAFVYSYYDLLPVLGSIQKNKKNRKLNKK